MEFGLTDRAWAWPIDPGSDPRAHGRRAPALRNASPVLSPAIEDFAQADEQVADFQAAIRQTAGPQAQLKHKTEALRTFDLTARPTRSDLEDSAPGCASPGAARAPAPGPPA